jgi:hypothetical protein
LAFRALDIFQERNKNLPAPRNEDHATQLLAIVNELNEKFPQKIQTVDEKLVRLFSYGAVGELAAMVRERSNVVNISDCCNWWYCCSRNIEGYFW